MDRCKRNNSVGVLLSFTKWYRETLINENIASTKNESRNFHRAQE